MSKQVAKTLEKARNILIEKGWCQGHYQHDSAYCALGAIWLVGKGDQLEIEAIRALKSAVGRDVVAWNDSRNRTKRQVLGAFTRAINAELKAT